MVYMTNTTVLKKHFVRLLTHFHQAAQNASNAIGVVQKKKLPCLFWGEQKCEFIAIEKDVPLNRLVTCHKINCV